MNDNIANNLTLKRSDIPADLLQFFEPAECKKCYVCTMVSVFREVRRVLRPDGTLFLNIGDSYARSAKKGGSGPKSKSEWGYGSAQSAKVGSSDGAVGRASRPGSRSQGLADKQLLGMPWRVALALQADGWYLRQEIIWRKPAPMPESVKDRCTRGHEHIFLLVKSRRYFWDHVGMFEPVTGGAHARRSEAVSSGSAKEMPADAPARARYNAGFNAAVNGLVSQRTARSIWTFATEGTKEKHFAAYPSSLVARCLAAGVSPAGCCASCFAPRRRVTVKHRVATRPGSDTKLKFPNGWSSKADGSRHSVLKHNTPEGRVGRGSPHTDSPANDHRGIVIGNRDPYRHVSHIETIGWEASCGCNDPRSVGCLVLDPFSGTAQTGRVAVAMGHCYIGIELSEKYNEIAHRNIARGWSPKKDRKKRSASARAPESVQRRFSLPED